MADYSRQIFPDLNLFKKEVTERFLITLMEIYRMHPVYKYNDNESKSRIQISPTYANITFQGKNPQLLIRVGGYQFNLNDYFNNNAMEEVKNEEGVISGFKSLKLISTVVSVHVRSYGEEESSDLADELAQLGAFSASYMFAQVGIDIRDVQISETQETDNNNDIYETILQFQVIVPWEFSRYTGKPAADPEIEFEFDDDIVNGYRSPGVYVFKGGVKKE